MTGAVTVVLGAAIGTALGALGGGGSVLTVPALVYALGQPAGQATTASLVIVGVSSLCGAVGHARAGRVRWRAGAAFGAAGVATSVVGSWANRAVDQDVLLLAFAVLMLVAAAGMIRRTRRVTFTVAGSDLSPRRRAVVATAREAAVEARPDPGDPAPGRPGRERGDRTWTAIRRRTVGSDRAALKMVLAGLAVGFLTGFFGVGGGFVIVPALTLALGFGMGEAVGTSLLIIAINSAAALVARAGHASFDWAVIIPFTVAAIGGSFLGKRLTDTVSGTALTRAFAVLLILIAGYVAAQSLLGLT